MDLGLKDKVAVITQVWELGQTFRVRRLWLK